MNIIYDFFHNHLLWTALAAFLIAQTIKFFINWAVDKRPHITRLFGDGGMPSGHSATVSALAAMTGYTTGFDRPLFAIAMVLAIIVMHDAKGVRREAGKQATSILLLFDTINKLLTTKDKIEQEEKLKTLVGHSPLQVFFGALLGIAVAALYVVIFGVGPLCYAT